MQQKTHMRNRLRFFVWHKTQDMQYVSPIIILIIVAYAYIFYVINKILVRHCICKFANMLDPDKKNNFRNMTQHLLYSLIHYSVLRLLIQIYFLKRHRILEIIINCQQDMSRIRYIKIQSLPGRNRNVLRQFMHVLPSLQTM